MEQFKNAYLADLSIQGLERQLGFVANNGCPELAKLWAKTVSETTDPKIIDEINIFMDKDTQ